MATSDFNVLIPPTIPPIPRVTEGLANATTETSTIAPPAPTPVPPVAGYTPASATSTPYTPTPYTVPDTGLVQEQVKRIVGEDSPLMQQARQLAMQQMNERGLINSSLGVTAGQQAVIAQALPIAQSDAAAYNAAMTNTANARNAASQFGAAAENTVALANQAAQNAAFSTKTQAENVRSLALIDTNTKVQLANLDNQYRQLLQTNQDASNMFNQVATNIANISQNKELSRDAKNAAITTQLNLLNEALKQQETVATAQSTAFQSLNLKDFFVSSNFAPQGPTPEEWQGELQRILDASRSQWLQQMQEQNAAQNMGF